MVLSAAGISLVGLFGRWGIADLSIASLMFFRYIGASALLLFSLGGLGRLRGFFAFRHLKLQLVRAFFVLLAQYCFFYYLSKADLLNASALLNTGPMFISLIEWGLLRKKVGMSSWVGATVSFIGALCILQPNTGMFSLLSLVGLLSGISQGASQVVFGIQSEKEEYPVLGVAHLFLLCSCLSFVPFLFSASWHTGPQFLSHWDIWVIVGVAVFSIMSQIFRARAYRLGTPSRLSPYLYFSVLLSGVWDWIFFHHIPNTLAILGATLIVLGGLLKVYLRNYLLKKR